MKGNTGSNASGGFAFGGWAKRSPERAEPKAAPFSGLGGASQAGAKSSAFGAAPQPQSGAKPTFGDGRGFAAGAGSVPQGRFGATGGGFAYGAAATPKPERAEPKAAPFSGLGGAAQAGAKSSAFGAAPQPQSGAKPTFGDGRGFAAGAGSVPQGGFATATGAGFSFGPTTPQPQSEAKPHDVETLAARLRLLEAGEEERDARNTTLESKVQALENALEARVHELEAETSVLAVKSRTLEDENENLRRDVSDLKAKNQLQEERIAYLQRMLEQNVGAINLMNQQIAYFMSGRDARLPVEAYAEPILNVGATPVEGEAKTQAQWQDRHPSRSKGADMQR